jgi:hypothetical protein
MRRRCSPFVDIRFPATISVLKRCEAAGRITPRPRNNDMRQLLGVIALLGITSAATAQTRLHAGASIGTQTYESSTDKQRPVPGVEVLGEHGRIGVHVAGELTNRATGGTFTALHANATYRIPFDRSYFVFFGFGRTFLHAEAGGAQATWNGELQVGFLFKGGEGYLGVRQYEYSYGSFRNECELCGKTPAISVGARWRIGS